MKYEAKLLGGIAVSAESGASWVNIDQETAKQECLSLGDGYDLISNAEFMTIAREIESVPSNWSGGSVASGCLFRGNNGINDVCGYDGANPESGTGRDIRARHLTLNSEEIWDLSGNVWEWIDWSTGGSLEAGPNVCSGPTSEIPVYSCGSLSFNDYMPANPGSVLAANYNSDFGLGTISGGVGGAGLRGNGWGGGIDTGVFTLDLSNTSSNFFSGVGFRCVYRGK